MLRSIFPALAAVSILAPALGGCMAASAGAAAGPGVSERQMSPARQVANAELAFAARGREIGPVPSFREFIAPGGIMFLPGPMVAADYLAKANWPGVILWRPEFVYAAASGDLAVSMGPSLWTVGEEKDPGYFLTIWAKQPDGSWKWLLDRGTSGTPDLYTGNERLDLMTGEASDAPAVSLADLEADYHAALAKDARQALASRLDISGRVLRAGSAPQVGRIATQGLAQKDPPTVQAKQLGGGFSASRDFAWTYGEASWDGGKGWYVRVWRYTGRWSILVDHLVAAPKG